MAPEQGNTRETEELTPTQIERGEFFIKACGLENIENETIAMYGQTGTVGWGLARCSEHLMDMTPAEITDMVTTQLAEQRAGQQQGRS